ncbi:MAG: type II toxin-antitoxin system RelE/ParE family toxin [Chloroflexi bacterium]|nr:type II toxin-antitoxin system RelE/ParE family toxin [Chloroflexota bacterium]
MKPLAYAIHFADPSVAKVALRLPDAMYDRINEAIQTLGAEPRGLKTKKLHGFHPPLYELRVHPYWVVYDVHDETQTVVILGIIHRKDLEKFLRRMR